MPTFQMRELVPGCRVSEWRSQDRNPGRRAPSLNFNRWLYEGVVVSVRKRADGTCAQLVITLYISHKQVMLLELRMKMFSKAKKAWRKKLIPWNIKKEDLPPIIIKSII